LSEFYRKCARRKDDGQVLSLLLREVASDDRFAAGYSFVALDVLINPWSRFDAGIENDRNSPLGITWL
jgi:hypothetical protein